MTAALVHAAVMALLLALTVQALLNARKIPRLGAIPVPPSFPRIAVLIPARNEAERIGPGVKTWVRQEYPNYELVVLDDDSTDETAERAAAAAAGARHARVIGAGALPDGWHGKPHACHLLRQATRAEILVFADADVLADPVTLRAVAGAFAALGVDALSAELSHTSPNRLVQALIGLQNWAVWTFVPWWLAAARRRPLFAVVNGQFVAMRAAVYDASGGFAAVRLELAEDVALGRRLVSLGYRVGLVDGAGVLACRPYVTLGALWRANVRNLAPALFGSTVLVLAAAVTLVALYVAPPMLLIAGLATKRVALLGSPWVFLVETLLGIGPRAISDRRARSPWWAALGHPLAIAALVGMSVDSLLRRRRHRRVEWRGRRYDVTRPAA
jgi:cellulose synthase/poly-beta-1,6-N-acetylglucosamine synthase-like glycosyltransferase